MKTRLETALGKDGAWRFYEASLADVLAHATALAEVSRYCFIDPPREVRWCSEWAPGSWRIEPQRGSDLAQRMIECFDRLLLRHSAVVMRNSDSPTLPNRLLLEAWEVLDRGRADVVFGPDLGGGYTLVGLSSPAPFLFEEVEMSSEGMLADTVKVAEAHGLVVATLEPWLDVDRPDDLRALLAQLTAGDMARRCPRTTQWCSTARPGWGDSEGDG